MARNGICIMRINEEREETRSSAGDMEQESGDRAQLRKETHPFKLTDVGQMLNGVFKQLQHHSAFLRTKEILRMIFFSE